MPVRVRHRTTDALAARRRAAAARADGHVSHRGAGRPPDGAADDERGIEPGADPVVVDVGDEDVGGFEAQLSVPPLIEVLGAGRCDELHLHACALRHQDRVVPGGIGHRTSDELATRPHRVQGVHLNTRDRNGPGRVRDPTPNERAWLERYIDAHGVLTNAEDSRELFRRLIPPPLGNVRRRPRRRREEELVRPLGKDKRVVAERIGCRPLAERRAGRREQRIERLHMDAREREARSALGDASAHEDPLSKLRVDAGDVHVRRYQVSLVEARLVVPPLAEVARPGWRSIEDPELNF